MTRYFFIGLIGMLLCAGCTSAVKNEDAVPPDEMAQSKSTADKSNRNVPSGNDHRIVKQESDLIGYWVGYFDPDSSMEGVYAGELQAWDYRNKINISIDHISRGQVRGHSVVAGNDRPFEGSMVQTAQGYTFALKEPGDDQYDGAFSFGIKTGDSLLEGTWKAYKKIRVASRQYTLTKQIFRYNPDWQMQEGQYVDWTKIKTAKTTVEGEVSYDASYFTTTGDVLRYNASKILLTKEQVANLKKADLFIIRNAIYARHGYSFKNQQLRAFFDRQPWYIPVSTDVKAAFTDIEKKNIDLLLRYEKNAKEYYDVFGRG